MDIAPEDFFDLIESDGFQEFLIFFAAASQVKGLGKPVFARMPGTLETIDEIYEIQQQIANDVEKMKFLIESAGDNPSQEVMKAISEGEKQYNYEIQERDSTDISDLPLFFLDKKKSKNTESIRNLKKIDSPLLPLRVQRGIIMRSVFFAIERFIKEERTTNIVYYTIDIPVHYEDNDVPNLVRLVRRIGENRVELFMLKDGADYHNEPMFPRLFVREGDEIEGIELPNSIRKKALENLHKWMESNTNVFSAKQIEILSHSLEFYRHKGLCSDNGKKTINVTNADIAKLYPLSVTTINEHMSNIGTVGTRIFGLIFNPAKDFAYYWHEMGLIFI